MAGHLMVVGGHISDAENMAGAVMLKHKKAGWDITIVHATTGEKGHPTLSATGLSRDAPRRRPAPQQNSSAPTWS